MVFKTTRTIHIASIKIVRLKNNNLFISSSYLFDFVCSLLRIFKTSIKICTSTHTYAHINAYSVNA